jgi:hypothetical protein
MIKHFTYDGLGRLIRTQSPYPDPFTGNAEELRSERYTYDGVRRIQEIRIDPMMSLELALSSEIPEVQELAESSLASAGGAGGAAQSGSGMSGEGGGVDGSATPLDLESGLLELAAGAGGSGTMFSGEGGWGGSLPVPGALPYREYVWGPGDAWHATPTDELLCYFGDGREIYFTLQDPSGDIAAITATGSAAGQGQNRAGVVAQLRYDAYGLVLAADHLYNHAYLSVGHKGLFFERLDRGVADAAAPGASPGPLASDDSPVDTPRLVPFARGVYHNRNRTLIPGGGSPQLVGLAGVVPTGPPGNAWNSVALSQQGLSSGAAVAGRFMQADPNATGMVVTDDICFHGDSPYARVGGFDIATRLTDGGNLLQYLQSSPIGRSDPTGLFIGDALGTYATLSFTAGRIANDLTEVYSANMSHDADWAMDWSLPDDWHSRGDNSWIQDIYDDAKIADTVNNSWDPTGLLGGSDESDGGGLGPMARSFPGKYVKGTAKTFKAVGLSAKGAGHHIFFRFYTRWNGKMKEIMTEIPPGHHRNLHTFVDRYMREKIPGLPSIYDPRGKVHWDEWMKNNKGQLPKIFREMKNGTRTYFKNNKITFGKNLDDILDEAIPF